MMTQERVRSYLDHLRRQYWGAVSLAIYPRKTTKPRVVCRVLAGDLTELRRLNLISGTGNKVDKEGETLTQKASVSPSLIIIVRELCH